VLLRANEQGSETPAVLNNFIDFLFLFGHFVRTISMLARTLSHTVGGDRPVKIWRRTKRSLKKMRRLADGLDLQPRRDMRPTYPPKPLNGAHCLAVPSRGRAHGADTRRPNTERRLSLRPY
jgi:hypothetical protein